MMTVLRQSWALFLILCIAAAQPAWGQRAGSFIAQDSEDELQDEGVYDGEDAGLDDGQLEDDALAEDGYADDGGEYAEPAYEPPAAAPPVRERAQVRPRVPRPADLPRVRPEGGVTRVRPYQQRQAAQSAAQAPDGSQYLPGITPADPERPQAGAVQDQPVNVFFEDTELSAIIKAIGAMTGRNFLFDPNIANIPVTLISHTPIEPEMLLPLLQSVLRVHGFTMNETLEDDQLIMIRPIGEEPDVTEMRIGEDDPDGFNEFFTYVVPVRYSNVEDLPAILQQLGSNNARITAYGPTNTLILTDTAHGIRKMLQFLRTIDIPGSEVVMEIFPLQYARAEVVSEQLNQILGESALGRTGGTEAQIARRLAAQRVRQRNVPGADQQTVVDAEEPQLRVVSDQRLNLLIVMASEFLMDQVRALIERLDTPTPFEENMIHVYELQNADAELMKEALNLIVGTPPRLQEEGAAPSAQVQPFEKEVVIESYEATNSLLVVASPQDYRGIKELIAQLDVPRRQVHVETIIMEVVIQDRYQLAVELTSLSAQDGFAINNVVNLANVLAGGPLAQAGAADAPVLTTGILDGSVEVPVPDGEGGLQLQTFPKIPLLLTALDSITDLEVLSKPMLMTVDNEERSFLVGQEVPVPTGTSTSLDQDAVDRSIYSRVDRRDVGIKMTVTPQISEGDNVFLELEVEVSQTVQSDIGADPNIVGPTFQKTNLTGPIVVSDSSTAVVGGLISETTDRSTRQTPYLGDLPLVGWLFGRQSDRRAKRNLVVLVTPHIIKGGQDIDRMTEYRIEEFTKANADVLFQKGFIKKIKQRHKTRTEHRPSLEELERLGYEEFSKGYIQEELD